ncbi:hypothetical protein BS47DRAFT_1369411 [Hydnum rufescens UP504]|uniref:Uncharacterized protein n=1 Tax=Hydnum rufescens UP504 TaxID=1448309 RepID=A0A9P6DM06_9AGAM|nr:hypothetical protein BS47DRAFT_1369411 [Hydnum rufescens UP504]
MRRMEEVVMRRPSGHMNCTPAAAGVWLYIMLLPQIKTCGASPPRKRDPRTTTRNDTKLHEPHTRYRRCVVLYKVITSATHQMKLGNDNAPTNREPQTRPAKERPPDETREREHITQDRRDPRRITPAGCVVLVSFHLNPHPHQPPIKIRDPAEQIRILLNQQPAPTPNQTLSPRLKTRTNCRPKTCNPGEGEVM